MVRPGSRSSLRRFTVSLDTEEYSRLTQLIDQHKPPLTLQYAVRYAVRLLLRRADDPQFALRFGDLLPNRETNDEA